QFRSNSYPAMAIDATGRIYVAWAERQANLVPLQRGFPSEVRYGEARIVMTTSRDGIVWRPTRLADDTATGPIIGTRHQVMPSLTFARGKLILSYYDARDSIDRTGQAAPYLSDRSTPPQVASPFATPPFWQTIDVRAAQADPADDPAFLSVKVSRYLYSKSRDAGGRIVITQQEFNPPNLPLFAAGTLPFIGDYVDLAPAPMFVSDAKG